MHTTSETSIYHKPCPEAFGYSLSSVNSKKEKNIMIVDELEIDIVGEKIGINQIYFYRYNSPLKVKPTHEIKDLIEIKMIL